MRWQDLNGRVRDEKEYRGSELWKDTNEKGCRHGRRPLMGRPVRSRTIVRRAMLPVTCELDEFTIRLSVG